MAGCPRLESGRFQEIALSRCQARKVDILDMVGVVGSSQIAPTNTKSPEIAWFPGFPVFGARQGGGKAYWSLTPINQQEP